MNLLLLHISSQEKLDKPPHYTQSCVDGFSLGSQEKKKTSLLLFILIVNV